MKILISSMKIWIFCMQNLRFSLCQILMIFTMIFLTIHKISKYKVGVSTGSVETRWLGGSFFKVCRNNAGRLGSCFISVCLETRWLGQKAVSMCQNDPVTLVGTPDPILSPKLSNHGRVQYSGGGKLSKSARTVQVCHSFSEKFLKRREFQTQLPTKRARITHAHTHIRCHMRIHTYHVMTHEL